MQYWILKTEPTTYSIDNLKKDKQTRWDGVRNYQARNNLSSMKKNDRCMIYHSMGPKEIVGTAKVVTAAYPDPSGSDAAWVCVDIAFENMLEHPVTLARMKSHPQLQEISLVRQGRLSVCPISKDEWDEIMALSAA